MSDERNRPHLRSRNYPIREDMAYQLKVWISVIVQED